MLAMSYLDNGQNLDLEKFNEMPDDIVKSSVSIRYDGARVFTDARLWKHTTKLPNIGAWQLEQAVRIPEKERIVLGNNTLNSTTAIAARKATFQVPDTVTEDTLNKLPYNSTIWIDDREIQLPAPFLETAPACSEWFYPRANVGVCLCLGGVPVNQAIDADGPTGCLGEAGYSWGFSSGVLGVAVALEWLWVCLAWTMWRAAPRRSTLVAAGRSGAGRLRNILDAAEAITGHLGDQHSAYAEKELEDRLRGAPHFGYVVESRRGVPHIGIRSVPTSDGATRRRATVSKETLYG